MGKKAKFKKIRRLASAMPVVNTRQIVRDCVVSGSELIEEGKTELKDGSKVIAAAQYVKKKQISVPINHNRKMKKLYYMAGGRGVAHYVNAVNQYQQKKVQ